MGRENQRGYKKGQQKSVIVFDDLLKLENKLENLPKLVARDMQSIYFPKAANIVQQKYQDTIPVAEEFDLARQSKKHKQKWGHVPPLYSTVIFVIRRYGTYNLGAFIGPEYPDGNKLHFDYHGTKDRTMSFWAKKGEANYRKRIKKKRQLAVEVFDAVRGPVNNIISNGIAKSIKIHMEAK